MPNQKENMYNNLTKDGYKLGTLEEFSTKMSDAKTRSILYNNLTKDGYKLGTLEEFSKIVYNPETNRSETIGQVASKVDKENETTSPIPSVIQEEASAQTASKPASPSSWQQTLDRFAAPTQGAPQVLTPSAQMEWKKNKDSQQVKEASKVLDYKGEGQKQIDAYNKQVQSPYATIPSTTEQAKRSLPDEAEEQKQIDAILGSTIQAAQAKGQEARNKSINTTTNLPVMNTPYAATARGILADKAYNEQITPSNIIGAIQEQIMNQGGQTSGGDVDPVQKEISDKSSRLQAQRIYDYVYQRLLEREIPKDKIQSFFMTMLNSNSLASLAKAAVLDESQRQMRAQAMEYKPELDGVAETTAEVLGMVISPEMLVGGTMGRMAGEKVASMGMSKVASNLGLNQASRMLATNGGQRIISGIVGSAANFATFEPLSYVGNSLGAGQDVTLGGVVTSIGKGAATGLVMGAFSQYVMPLFHNKVSSAITDKVLGKGATAYWTNKVVDYGTDLAGRTAIFGCSSLVQQAATNPNFDLAEEAPKAFMDALATNIGFDIHGAIIKSIQVHDAISKSERTNNIRNFIKKYTTETTKRNEDGSVSPEYKSAITEDRLKEILSKNDKDLTLLEQSIKKDFNDQYKSERYPSAYIDAFLGDHSGNKFAFTKDDIRTANKCGIELNSVEELANELAEMASKDASEGSKYNTDETSSDLAKFMQTSRLGKLLSNDNMTASLRNKIIGAITGRFYDNILVTKVSDVMEEGGAYYVTTYNPTGIVESRKFSNEKSAKNFRESQREASRNGILIYNMIQLEQEMNALNDIEKQKQIAKILFPENPDGFAILNEVIEKAKRGEELNDDETTIVTFYKNRMSRDAKSKNVRNVIDDIAKQFMKEYGMTHEEYFKLINSNYKDLSVAEKNKFRDFSQRIEDALKEMTKTPEQKKVEQTQEQIVDEIITETENKIAEQEALNQVTEYPDENVGMVLSVNKDSKGYSLNQYFEQGTQATDINTIKSDLQALGAKMNPETKAIIDEAFANGNVEEVVKSLNGKMTEEDIQYIATKQAQKGYTYTQVEQAKQKVVEQVNSQYGKVTGKVSRGVVDGKEVTITSQEGDEVAYYINPETGQPEHTTWDKVQNVQTIDLSELVKTRCAEEEARINAEIDHVINHSPETHMDYQKGTSFYTLNEKGEKKLNKVVGVDEDGNVLFGELNDKGEPTDVHALKPEEIKALEDEAYYGSKEETATEEPVVETAPAPEVAETTTPAEVTTPEEPVAETPQAEPEKPVSALDSIPKDDKGKTIWTQAESPEVAAKAMLEVHEGNETDAIDTIDSIIEGAKKALEKANNAKPKASTDPNDIIEEKSKIKKSIEEAKNNLDFWKKVRLELQTSMPEEIDNIANDVVEQKKQASNVAKINAIGLDESASVYDYVLGWIASGAKFKFGNDEHSKGLSSETGYGKNDFGLFMLDSKNGQTPDQMAQTIFESMPERLREQTDDMEIKNHIIDIIGSYKNYTEMADEFVRRNTFDESAHEEYVPEGEANNEPISFENVHQGETPFSVDKNAPEEAPTSPADQLAKMLNITDGRVITERDVNERTAKGSKKRAAAMELLEQANAIRKAEEDIKAQIDAFVNARNEALNEWEEMENLAAQERRAKVEPFIKTLRDELSKYAIEGSVVIVESMNDLPEDMRNHQSILSGNWFAFAHENGKVYVNPYKITSHDTARSKVWHEVVAHKGVSAFVEGQGVNSVDFFNDIYDSLSKPEQKDWLGYVLGYNLNQTQKADVIAMANHHMTYAELLSKDKELAKQCYDRAYNTFFLDDLSAKEQNVLADMYRHQAGDEMVAHLADSQGVSSGFMTKMKAYFNKFARELGNKLGIDMGISESEIKYIIGETAKDMNIKTTAKKGVVLIDKAISDIDSGKDVTIPASDGKSNVQVSNGNALFSFESRKAESELLNAMYRTNSGKWAKQMVDASPEEREDAAVRFSVVKDKDKVEKFEKDIKDGNVTYAYRKMQLIDGKLYPPMAAKVGRNLVDGREVGDIEVSDEFPDKAFYRTQGVRKQNAKGEWDWYEQKKVSVNAELIKGDDGAYYYGSVEPKNKIKVDENTGELAAFFTLKKGSKGANGKDLTDVDARYNSYIHSSNSMCNDQFSSAYNRPNLVTVKIAISNDDLNSGNKRKYCKDAVGSIEWKSGAMSQKLKDAGRTQRMVNLSEYGKIVEVIDAKDVAEFYAKELEGTGIVVPFNTVEPALRDELVKLGVKIGAPENNKAGKAAIPAYKEWLKNNPNDPNGGGKKTTTSEGAKFSADYEKAYEEKDEQKASEIVRDAFHVAYPDTKVVDEKGMQKSNPDIRFSYTTDENGRALSERALDAKDNGTYPKMEFRKAYDINGKTFDALKDLHFISNSEWHHTGKNFNQTDFYSWWDSDKAHGSTDYSESYEAGEDLLAKYNANKDKIKSLAEKASKLDWQFKDKESVPEFGMFAHNVAEKEVSLTPEEENMKKNGHVAISNSGEPSAYMRKLEHEDLDNKYYTILSNRRDEYVKEHESELRQMYDEKYGDIIKSNEEIDKYNASTDGKEKALKEIATLMGETPEEATRLVNGVSRTARDQIKRDAEQKDYESRKAEAKVLADKKQKELDKWVQKNISEGKIKVVDRVKKDDLPENFVETKREMYGKYGWFESQPYKYRLPEYYSGYGFESKRTKTAYDNRVQDISNIRNLRFSVDEDIERDVAGRPIMPEFKSVAEAISPEGRARMNAWTEEARKWDMAHPLDVKNRKAAASRVEKLIKTALDDADVDEVTKSKLVSAMKAIKNTGTINLNEQTSKGFKIAASAISKAYEKQIHDLMMLKVRDKNGRGNAVGKKVDAITAQAFEFLRNFYDTKSKKFIVDSAILDAKLTELEEKMSNRIDDSALTDDEAMKEQAQKTAYEILKRVSESNVTATKLQELIENGKSNDERLKELYQLRREGNENYSNDEGETIVVADEITRIKKLQEANDMDINSQMQAKMDAQDVIRTKLADLIEGGRDYKKSKAEAEQDRRRNLVASMMEAIDSDLEITQNDVDTGRYDEEKNLLKKPFSKLWHGVMDTFEYMCKNYATNGVNGENWMYDYFIKGKDGVVQAQSNYEHSMRVHAETLDAKCKEIFGKKFLDVVEDNSKFYKNSGVHVDTDVDKRGENRLGEQGGKRELSLTKGQGTYLYMLWRMNDGNAQLIREGFTEESMEEIANFIGEKNQKFADFMQLEYLPQLREKYNDRYIEVFDTSMAHVDNYVPLRRSKMKRLEGEDFTATGKSNPKVVTKGASALIERVHNTHSIDHTADAFKVLYDHLSEMEEWYNFARVRQDLQYVLNSAAVRNRMNRNDTGSWARFRDAAKSACHVKDGGDMATADHAWSELARTFATSAIAYRYGTALKQTLSLPAFLDYSADPRYLAAFAKNMGIEYGVDIFGFAKTIPTLGTGFKDRLKNRAESQAWFTEGLSKNLAWCMNNIPDFYERVINQATSVDPIMNDKSNLQKTGKLSEDIWYYINKYRDNYAEAGFATNKLVDAATCAIGAKSIYDYKYARLMEGVAKKYKKGVAKKHKEGTPQYENAQKEAHRLAVMDATLAFNSSQQSSHGAFLSPIQREKSFASKMLTLFKNSPMSYSRKLASNIQSLYRCAENMKSGKMTDYYAKRIMLENPKMSEEDARSEANKHIAWESGRATWGIALYGYILPWLWSQGGKGIIGLFQPDEDDNKKTDKELEEEKWQNYSEQAGFIFDGVPSVSVAMDIARITANVSQDWSINTSNSGLAMINDALKEGKRVYDEQGMISPQMASLIISKSAKIGSGFDINTWSNIGIGLAGLAKDGYIGAKDLITGEDSDPKSFENCLIDLMFIMNSPKSQRVKLAKDFYKDMPYAEYEKAVKLASEYYTDTLPYVSWLPQNKMVKEKKAKEMYEEFLRYHSADGSAQKRVEDKDAVKEINSEREAISSDKKLDNYIKSTDRYEEFNQYRDKMADFSVLTATHQTWVSLMRTNPTKAREYKQEHMDDIKKYERLYGKYAQAKSLIGRLGDKPEKDDELFNKAMKLLEE